MLVKIHIERDRACLPGAGPDIVLLIECSEFTTFKTHVYLGCIECHPVDMTLDAPKMSATFKGKFGTPNGKVEVCA